MQSQTSIYQSQWRVDAEEKVTGRAKYTHDVSLPGILSGKILRSPYAHAKILNIDTSKAEKLNGVKVVLTHRNTPNTMFGSGIPLVPGVGFPDERIFNDKVRFFGEPVAAVAATSLKLAEEALELIEVEYKQLKPVFHPEEALKTSAPKVHKRGNVAHTVKIDEGNLEKGFREADYVLEDRYTTQAVYHGSLETHVCVVAPEPGGRVTVWTSTQAPFLIRNALAQILGLPISKIRVIKSHVGGAFGSKMDPVLEPMCTLLALRASRPVRLEHTREESFYGSRLRHPSIIDLKMAAKSDGKITALQARVVLDTGAYLSQGGIVLACTASSLRVLYKIPNVHVDGYVVYTNSPVAGAFRGFGFMQGYFALESHLDRIAEALDIDPVELRIKNAVKVGDPNPFNPSWTINSGSLQHLLHTAAQRIGWPGRKPKAVKTKTHGIGVSSFMFVSGANPYRPESSSAIVKLNEDGSATLLTGISDIGTGSMTALRSIVAEELTMRADEVIVNPIIDTDIHPFDVGAYADATVFVGGNAAKLAAQDAKRQLLTFASEMLKVDQSELVLESGRIVVKTEPSRSISMAEVIRSKQLAMKDAASIIGKASYEPKDNGVDFGAQFAEVEVDVETGFVKVLRIVSAHDVGRAINLSAVEGQVEGGAVQGIGGALLEQMVLDKENGMILNSSFADYKMATALDVPDVEPVILEAPDPSNPLGVKGVGECGVVGVAPAIANAIYDAVGARITDLPITPEKVLKALKLRASHK